MMLDMTMGLDTVADFTQHVANGRITGEARRLWYAEVLEPVDQGLTPEGKRKIRPIGLGEALLKFAESVALG
eukprot:7317646-Lingulodinium_polyedra.AAC.1